MAQRSASVQRVAIAGASTPLGKELKQVLAERKFPAADIVLLDEGDAAGALTEAAGEATFIQPVGESSFKGSQFAFFAGSPEIAARHSEAARKAGATVIDLSGGVGRKDGAFTWIPSLDLTLPPPSATEIPRNKKPMYRSPSAAVIIASTVAAALKRYKPARIAILFFPPVSEAGQAGVIELESQTSNLLSFHAIEKKVFDAQVAFNLLAGYGEKRKPSLEEIRERVASETAQYLDHRTIAPAIQLIQAPVFYGYAFAAYVDFASEPKPAEIEAAFVIEGVEVTAKDDAAPDNVSAAGMSEIQIGRVERDPNVPTGAWLWGVADNLNLAATNAVRIAEELLAVPE